MKYWLGRLIQAWRVEIYTSRGIKAKVAMVIKGKGFKMPKTRFFTMSQVQIDEYF